MPDIPVPSFVPRFACTGCGKCCTGGGSYVVEVNRAEQRRIQKLLGISRAWFRRRYLFRFDEAATTPSMARGPRLGPIGDEKVSLRMPKGRCVFLDTDNRCRIYTARPLQCRTYPWWPELMNRRAWRLEARRCEGIGQGDAVPLTQVRRALARQAR